MSFNDYTSSRLEFSFVTPFDDGTFLDECTIISSLYISAGLVRYFVVQHLSVDNLFNVNLYNIASDALRR